MKVSEEFAPNLAREYKFWDLFVSPKQRYLGRSYIWWRDKSLGQGENMAYDDLPDEALLETKKIWRDVVRCCRMLGYRTEPYGEHFRLNTTYLANERKHHNGHMHMHFFPRTEVNFISSPIGVETLDQDFDKMYASGGADRTLSEGQMATLRRLFRLYAIA
jgi:hypothetical protein